MIYTISLHNKIFLVHPKTRRRNQQPIPENHYSLFRADDFRFISPLRNENTCDKVSFPFLDWGDDGRLRLLVLRSDRLLCIRRIATPCSSVAKSNPRSTDTIPVAISVLLAARTSTDGLRRSSVAELSFTRDLDERREADEDGRWRAVRCARRVSVRSRYGSFLLIQRIVSRSSGANPDFHAFPM